MINIEERINKAILELIKRELIGFQAPKKDIAERMGYNYTNVNSALNGNEKYYTESFVSKFNKAFDGIFNEGWLLGGDDVDMFSGTNEDVLKVKEIYHPKSPERLIEQGTIKLYDIEAAANLSHLIANTNENIIGEISIPNIPTCDGALYIRGDSMYPLLKSGDIVAYKVIPNEISSIIYGEMYLVSMCIAGDEYLTVKYVNKSDMGDDWIKLVSYNKHHEPKDFPLKSVRAIALVKFSIRMNTMS